MRFFNRRDAGRKLASLLKRICSSRDTVVYAIPRGGVPVGIEVAKELNVPIDLIITGKIGHPLSPEYAVCAVNDSGEVVCDRNERVTLDAVWLNGAVLHAQQEIERRRELYLGSRARLPAKDKTAIVVDDGITTGISMRAALRMLQKDGAKHIIVATPVASREALELLVGRAELVILADTPGLRFGSVATHYENFAPVSDREVIALLRKYHQKRVPKTHAVPA